jgi:hypothetical protein
MYSGTRYVVPAIGASALILSVFSSALASGPPGFHQLARVQAKHQTINGKLTVTDVLRANKNTSVYGHFYAHNNAQVWAGLLVHNGGIKTDSLDVSGQMAAAGATFSGNVSDAGTLQATTINGGTLSLTGAGSVGGALTAAGKVTVNGLDAGTGNVTTTGLSATGQVTAGSIASSGGVSAGSFTTTGALNAASATLQNLTVGGTVNFGGATVTGLSIGGLGGTVDALTIGGPTKTSSPLTVSENGKTVTLGVDANGNLTLGSALFAGGIGIGGNTSLAGTLNVAGATTLAGNLNVGGSNGVTTTSLTAPTTSSSSSTLGTLTLTGGTLALNGPITASAGLSLNNGGDLNLSTNNTSAASHINAAGDHDVAGTAVIAVPNSTPTGTDVAGLTGGSGSVVNFTQAYSSMPIVTLTPQSIPSPPGAPEPKVWVTPIGSGSAFTGFTIHYAPMADVGATGHYTVTYGYQVIGQ